MAFCFIYDFMFQVISETKHCVENILLAIWETFSYENDFICNPYKFSYKFAFIPLFGFL